MENNEIRIFRIDDPFTEKLDYGKIKRDVVNVSTSPKQKALLLQALRWKLTKAKTDFKREKMLESYVGCDLLGCRTDLEQRGKVIKELSSSDIGNFLLVKEEWARLINTIASLRKGNEIKLENIDEENFSLLKTSKGRNYLSPNEPLIICMQKVAIGETSDTSTRQHLLAALQKLSLRLKIKRFFKRKSTNDLNILDDQFK